MLARDRVIASIEHKTFDRIPIKHLAVSEVDDMLMRYFNFEAYDDLLDILGHDFREIQPRYCGSDLDGSWEYEHGVVSAFVWAQPIFKPAARHTASAG